MSNFQPFNLSALALLGVALLVATRIVYGVRRRWSLDPMRRVMQVSGWFLIVAGLVGITLAFGSWASFLLLPLLAGIVVWNFFEFSKQERSARLGQVAIALDRGLPLVDILEAMARERGGRWAGLARFQAHRVATGTPYSDALEMSGDYPEFGPALAVGIGESLGGKTHPLGEALRLNAEQRINASTEIGWLFYLYVILVQAFVITSFLAVKIVPVLVKMFDEFAIDLNVAFESLVTYSQVVMLLLVPVSVLFVPLTIFTYGWAMTYDRGSGYFARWFSWMPSSIDQVWILRGLAWSIAANRPVEEALPLIRQYYRGISARRRLSRAIQAMNDGLPWIDALRFARLLSVADARLLRAAERTGNITWALREVSQSIVRRRGLWLKRLRSVAFPLGVLFCAIPVALTACGVLGMIADLVLRLA